MNTPSEISEHEATITGAAGIIIRDEVTVLTNDASKTLLSKEQKNDSYSSEEEDENIKQKDSNNNIEDIQEKRNSTDIESANDPNSSINNSNINDSNSNNNNENINTNIENDNITTENDDTAVNDTNSISINEKTANTVMHSDINNEKKSNDIETDNNNTSDDKNIIVQEEEETNDNKDQLTTSTFLTETAETHLLKATDVPNQRNNSDNKIVQSQPIDPAEIEAAFNALLEKNTYPPPEYTDSIIQLINHKRMDCLEESDYRGAENLDSVLDNLIKKSTEDSNQKMLNDHEQQFNNRLNSIKDKISDINARYDSKIQAIQINFEETYQQVMTAQEMQMRQFKEKWQNPEFLKQFDKPSKSLLSLCTLEKKMALSGLYKDARNAKLQADRMQQREEREMQKQIEAIMKGEFLKLRNQQQLEVNKMSARNDALLEEVEMQRIKELEPLNITLKKLENKKKSNLSKNIKSKSVTIAIPKVQQNSPSASQKTPRTAQRVIKYKNNCQTDFSILPIDDQQFQRLTSMSTRQKVRAKSSLAKKSLPPL